LTINLGLLLLDNLPRGNPLFLALFQLRDNKLQDVVSAARVGHHKVRATDRKDATM